MNFESIALLVQEKKFKTDFQDFQEIPKCGHGHVQYAFNESEKCQNLLKHSLSQVDFTMNVEKFFESS